MKNIKKGILLCCSIVVCFCLSSTFAKSSAFQFLQFLGNNPREETSSFANLLPGEVKLFVGGDIMLSRNIGSKNKKSDYQMLFSSGSYNPRLEEKPCAQGNCLGIFNLESLFASPDNDQPYGGFSFRANTGNIQTLLNLRGKNDLLLSLANNHTNNVGGKGIQLTRSLLAQHDIFYVGAGESETQARQILQYKKNGLNLCFQAYSYDGTSGRYGGTKMARNPLKKEVIIEDLQKMEKLGCDAKILMLHWGAEYKFFPNQSQKFLAEDLIDAGADLILGGHSHIPGEIRKYKEKYIISSFGNFIFDQNWGKTVAPSKVKSGEFDGMYDYQLQKLASPTYIPLMALFTIKKASQGVTITLDKLKTSTTDMGIHTPLDQQTHKELMDIINPSGYGQEKV